MTPYPDPPTSWATLVSHGDTTDTPNTTDTSNTPDTTVAPPIYPSSTFYAQDAADFAAMATEARHERYYTRYGNPTHRRAERVLAQLEGAETALLTSSGMGAISTTLLALLSQGDHVIAQKSHYMGTTKLLTEILPRYGIETTLVDQTQLSAFEQALKPNTRVMMLETPVNPLLTLTDLRAVCDLAKAHSITTVVDNTFASPINQRPLVHGADLVVHAATKFLGGHHDLTAGVILGRDEQITEIWQSSIVLGSVLSAFDAWLLLRGLRTLPMRIRHTNETALEVAHMLENHPHISHVHYPGLLSHPQHALAKQQMAGFGGVMSFEVHGDYAATARFMEGLTLIRQAVSLGGFETLAVHAAAMWAGTLGDEGMKAAGVNPTLVRLSLGLEDASDLISDLQTALGQLER